MNEETTQFVEQLLPVLMLNCQKLATLFENIDRLEVLVLAYGKCPMTHVCMQKMVHIVKLNVDEVERDVAAHEKTQTMQPIKTIMKSFASTFVCPHSKLCMCRAHPRVLCSSERKA